MAVSSYTQEDQDAIDDLCEFINQRANKFIKAVEDNTRILRQIVGSDRNVGNMALYDAIPRIEFSAEIVQKEMTNLAGASNEIYVKDRRD